MQFLLVESPTVQASGPCIGYDSILMSTLVVCRVVVAVGEEVRAEAGDLVAGTDAEVTAEVEVAG
jgi:hypothetical protein